MKKVKLTKRVRLGGKSCKTGTVVEVDGETFDSIVEKGLGEEYFGNEGGIKVGGGAGGKGKGTDGDISGLDSMTRSELMDFLKGANIEFDTRDDKATLLGLAKQG